MNRSIIFRIVMALVLVAALAGIGFYAFNAGIARGMAVSAAAPVVSNGTAPLPYPYYGFHGYPFFGFGFGCFGVLIPLFLLFLVFAAFRGLFFHGLHGWRRWGYGPWGMHHGPWGEPPSGEGGATVPGGAFVPPMVAEWHRRMHEQQGEKKAE